MDDKEGPAPEEYQQSVLDRVEARVASVSDMTRSERQFLNGIVRMAAPKKMLELGVAAGGSSAVILNATEDMPESRLHSVDLSPIHYEDPSRKTGYAVPFLFPHLVSRWDLRLGGTAARFMDDIGDGIDLCLLDTAHVNPGEFLDLLMVLPYLKRDVWVVVHDTAYHFVSRREYATTCGVLYACLYGRRYSPARTEYGHFPNIGAVRLSPEGLQWNTEVLFRLLTLPWHRPIPAEEEAVVLSHLRRHYAPRLVRVFEEANALSNAAAKASRRCGFDVRSWIGRVRSACLEPVKYALGYTPRRGTR